MPVADVVVTVQGPGTGGVGATLVYTVLVTNLGPDAAEGVVVRGSVAGPAEILDVTGGGTVSGNDVTWPAIATLADNGNRSFTVNLRATGSGTISWSASASSVTTDSETGNNDGTGADATLTTSASIVADLGVATDLPVNATGGDTLAVAVLAVNEGPSDATGVALRFQFPPSMTVLAIAGGGTEAAGVVSWPAQPLAAGDTIRHTLDVVVPLVGPFTTTVMVSGQDSDPANGNNQETVRSVVLARALRTISGSIIGEQFGWEVENLGDIDADGFGDFSVSAPTANLNGAAAGRVYVYSGFSGSLLFSFEGASLDLLGIDMDGGADFNNDNVPDLIVGAPATQGSGRAGRVVVYSLADGSVIKNIQGENPGDQFGNNAGVAGDVNNDGVTDLLVGAPTGAGGLGRAYVYSGADWSLLLTVDGRAQGSQFGHAGRGVGDLNNDNMDDIAIGAPGGASPDNGTVYVLSGADGSDLLSPIGADATGSQFGSFWIFSPGDMNSDGVNDIYAADLTNAALGNGTGRAWIFSGANGSPILTMTGESSGDNFGIGHPAGDLNGDGIMDLSVASWLSSEGANKAGKVYLINGADGSYFRTITSIIPGENLGFDAYVVDDLTGDGVRDLVVSGGISTSTTGRVYVIAGVAP